MNRKNIIVALSGQPNCGKSTMFNAITGSTARVGNYPGITVERMEGHCKTDDYKINFIDLPGTYSLTSYSMEEIVARDVIINEKPDVVVCMLDAVALERSLYLAVQLLEIGIPVIIALNMMDDVRRKGIHIDSNILSELLHVPVVECVARRGIGKQELINAIIDITENKPYEKNNFEISYGTDLDTSISEMHEIIEKNDFLNEKYPSKWIAVKYLEEDENIFTKGKQENEKVHNLLLAIVKKTERHIERTLTTYPEAMIADYRYGYIQSLLKQGVIVREYSFKHSLSEKLDRVLTQRFFGPIVMVGVLYLLFWLTFRLGAYPQGWLEDGFDFLGQLGNTYIANEFLRSLVVSGIIDGVGAVLGFAPLILIMFAMLCFLEDLGYMARVAYMLDKVLKTFGLHGASVMPFIVAGGIPGGCAVPAVMSARTLKSPKERLTTVLTAPFMVCGAKTTVFLMFAEIFFPGNEINVMLFLTLAAWFVALIVSKILRSSVIRGKPTPFIMELPPYRLPTLYGVATHTLDRVWQFVKKAGTVIFAISIIIWALMTFPQLPQSKKDNFDRMRETVTTQTQNNQDIKSNKASTIKKLHNIEQQEQMSALKYSFGGRMGLWLEHLSKYAGFPWQANIALIGGFAAKEVIISTFSIAYSLGNSSGATVENANGGSGQHKRLQAKLLSDPAWSLPAVISLFIFMLLYAPCFVTVVSMAKETSWRWALFGTFGSLIFTYILCVIVYQLLSVFLVT